jgi:hypothetical protein
LENVLEYRLAHLRCVGEQLSQLLDLHLGVTHRPSISTMVSGAAGVGVFSAGKESS